MTVRSELTKRVLEALTTDERTAEIAIDVVDDGGVIRLSGIVGSDDARDAAQSITEAQDGVISVINELELELEDPLDDLTVPVLPPHAITGA